MDHDNDVAEIQGNDLQLDAAIVIADPDRRASAVAVAATCRGSTVLITCIAWTLPIR